MSRNNRNSNARDDAIRRALHRISGTVWIYLITVLFIALVILSGRLFIEDVQTTMWGYQQFPTNKGSSDVSLYVALFFPVMQMTMGAMAVALFTDDNKGNDKWGYLFSFLAIVGFLFDISTDLLFRVHGNMTATTFFVAVGETFLIYTIASEIALSIGLTGLIVILPYSLRSIGEFFRRLKTGAPSKPQINHNQQRQQPKQPKGGVQKKQQQPPNMNQALLRRDPELGQIHRDLTNQGY